MTQSWTLRSLIPTLLLALVVTPLMFVTVLLFALLNPALLEQQQSNQTTLGLSLARQVNVVLDNGASDLTLLANFVEQAAYGFNPIQFSALVNSMPLFSVVYLTDVNGIVLRASAPQNSRINMTNLEWLDISRMPHFKAAMSGERWSEAFLSPASGELVVSFNIPLQQHANYAYVIGEMAIGYLPSLLQEIKATSQQTVMVLDSASQLIGHPNRELSNQQLNLSNLALPTPVSHAYPSNGLFRFQGNGYYGSRILLKGIDWSVIVAVEEKQFYQLQNRALLALIASTIAAIILALLLTRKISSWLFRTFTGFSSITSELASGNYQLSIAKDSRIHEYRQLYSDLQATADAIADREKELALINEELESRVTQRTLDLQQSNNALSQTLERLQVAQDELIESGKLAALGSLVAGISHELNTPIGIGVTASSTLFDEVNRLEQLFESGQLTRDEFQRAMEHIRTGADLISRNLVRAAQLVASFKQVSVDQSSDVRRPFKLMDTLHDTVYMLEPKYKASGYNIHFGDCEDADLQSYPGALIQVVTNLIENAINHGYESQLSGTVSIESEVLDGEQVRIHIGDQGKGIKDTHLKRIFEPFFTTRLGKGGSGLGLNIVHSLVVKVLGGKITVERNRPKGTRFVICIPLIAPESADSAVADEN